MQVRFAGANRQSPACFDPSGYGRNFSRLQIHNMICRQKVTWRVAMLLALASARRASDLSLLHIDEDHLFKTNDSWRFHLVFGAKQDRPGHIPQDVIISKHVRYSGPRRIY